MTIDHVVFQEGGAGAVADPNIYQWYNLKSAPKSRKVKCIALLFIFTFLTIGLVNPFGWSLLKKQGIERSAEPQQIHLSPGADETQITVSWSSLLNKPSKVYFGTSATKLSDIATSKNKKLEFVDSYYDFLPYFHAATLKNLQRRTRYFYQIVSDQGKSRIYSFVTWDAATDWKPKLLFVGGIEIGSRVTSKIKNFALENGDISGIFQSGDFGRDLSKTGDAFMNEIQELTARYPYLTVPGDQETNAEFLHYRYRFSMPNTPWPMPLHQLWYSFNIGKAHVIGYSTEVYYHKEVHIQRQLKWLMEDLNTANTQREKYPWIIVVGHRPLYTSVAHVRALSWLSVTRNVRQKFEDLFSWQGVDLVISSHEHMYERTWPVYRDNVTSKSYVNPHSPVHINLGSTSARRIWNSGIDSSAPWSAFQKLPNPQDLQNFGMLEVTNNTHLNWKLIQPGTGVELDNIWLVQKTKHGKFMTNEEVNYGKDIILPDRMFAPIFYDVQYLVSPWRVLGVLILLAVLLHMGCKKHRKSANFDFVTTRRKNKASPQHIVHY